MELDRSHSAAEQCEPLFLIHPISLEHSSLLSPLGVGGMRAVSLEVGATVQSGNSRWKCWMPAAVKTAAS